MSNPYKSLPDRSFWRPSIAQKNMFDLCDLWDPKFDLKKEDNVVTFGSCFAQHIGNALMQNGFKWLSTEHPPFSLSVEDAKEFNYNIFSARTGNIYTTTLLKQWTEWALEKKVVPEEVWEKDDRFYDCFRPRIEPNGFVSADESRQSLMQAVNSFKHAICEAQYFVFTLGLTESWVNTEFGYEYPMCPGTIAGKFDESKHKFVNLQFNQIISALTATMEMMREVNPQLKFILTVSPVPLTATNSDSHVLIATMASKSILRAATQQLITDLPYVDYFPSYEIINSPVFRGVFFEPNMRSVNQNGVAFVMNHFFSNLANKFDQNDQTNKSPEPKQNGFLSNELSDTQDDVCDESLLEAFSK